MTIFNTAYDTTVGQGAVLSKVIETIKESHIKDPVVPITNSIFASSNGFHLSDNPVVLIDGRYESQDNIPFFYHPLVISMRNAATKESKDIVFCDVRTLVTNRYTTNSGSGDYPNLRIRNESEFMFSCVRAALSSAWLSERASVFRDVSYIPNSMFVSWISEAVARRYALDAKDQLTLGIITAIYYQTLFVQSYSEIKDNADKIVYTVMKSTRAPSEMVYSIFEKIEKIDNVKDFCNVVKDILENTRLNDFNEGILVTVVGNTWFGVNAKEVMAVALEHPPTWLTLVFFSFTERSYKNSVISKIATRYIGRKGEDDFVKAFSSFVKQYLSPEEVVQL